MGHKQQMKGNKMKIDFSPHKIAEKNTVEWKAIKLGNETCGSIQFWPQHKMGKLSEREILILVEISTTFLLLKLLK